ncbi:AraC-type DNA-binding protein [Evansella caseinilytica]|uniref:AraC-type DNA-binding protein n=1 Tax=Evansella caseinilytica TaxID=1503961 RepID=A0A1H3P109_9BACI|nr:AraC family transcriptional regulator [Evansella caseinilytica]SDY94782.1 AraC-type DNA-binding protein [Evansella caseinilytica]
MSEFLKANVSKPVDFILGGQFITTESWRHMRRNHDDIYVLIINLNNNVYIEQNGLKYAIKPGEVFILLPNQVHTGYKPSVIGTSYYWFHFLFPYPVEVLDENEMDREVTAIRSNHYAPSGRKNTSILLPVHSSPLFVERIHILCKQLLDVSKANFYNNYCVDYLATSLLIELSEQTIANFTTSKLWTDQERKISTVLEWIRIHALTKDISVAAIAEQFSYNSDYLTRIFKKTTGMSIQEYLHVIKIAKAKELLVRTSENIKVISDSVGISDEKYFMRLFKKYEKVTPSEYRQAYFRVEMNNF